MKSGIHLLDELCASWLHFRPSRIEKYAENPEVVFSGTLREVRLADESTAFLLKLLHVGDERCTAQELKN
jgi:hypothetical protein